MIEVEHLCRRYGRFLAVDDVSFSIGPGEIVGLLGHNGAGKTSIMKMLTGYLEPDSGSVRVDGVEVERDRQRVQGQLGYLPENLPLYPELTVMDYLAFTARLRGVDAARAVPHAVAATELQHKALDPIGTLSRGYRQRVGVAQAILHEPRFLVLDEPTNGLDPGQTQQMRDLIRRLAEHATIILSTHIMQEVNAVCDRVLILRTGELVVDERLETLRASNELQLRTAPEADPRPALAGLDALAGVRSAGAGHWHLELRGEPDAAAAAVTAALVTAGIPVYRIAPATRDLETLFREVSDPAGIAAGTLEKEARDAA